MARRFRPTPIFGDMIYSWQSQAKQYPQEGKGLVHRQYHVPGTPPDWQIDTLLMYDGAGQLAGILNHYPVDMPPWERAGNVNVWVRPSKRRQGIATLLIMDAMVRWDIDPDAQRYSPEGAAVMERLHRNGLIPEKKPA